MSILAILIPALTATVALVIGLLSLAFATAPGWRELRWFAAIALTAAVYSVGNLAFVTPVSDAIVVWATRLNWAMATVHVGCWLIYSRLQAGEATGGTERAVGVVTAGLAGLVVIPDVVIRRGAVHALAVPEVGVTYRLAVSTAVGDAVMLVLLAGLTVVMIRYAHRARRGLRGAASHLVAFGVFYAAATLEIAVTMGLLDLPFLVDVGFLAVVLAGGGDMTRRLVGDARRLTALTGDLEAAVQARTRELVETRDALVRADRQAALGRLAAGVGHEVNNPLSYVIANLEHLRAIELPREDRAVVEETLEGAERMAQVIRELQQYGRPTAEATETVDVNEAVGAALSLVRHDLRHRAHIVQVLEPGLSVVADRSKLGQVFLNLLINASQAIEDPRSSEVRPTVRIRSFRRDGDVVVEVHDEGPGIPPEVLPRIFEPYFTTKDFPRGTGLGLSIVERLVHAAGGSIEAESEPGHGTTFRVRLPATDRPGARGVERTAGRDLTTAVPCGSRGRVLVAEDEPLVARAIRRTLRDWQVDVARDGAEALAMLEDDDRYDAILSDLMMPGLTGMDLHAELERSRPDLAARMIFVTGGAVTERSRRFVERRDLRCLSKPLDSRQLREMLEVVARPCDAA